MWIENWLQIKREIHKIKWNKINTFKSKVLLTQRT